MATGEVSPLAEVAVVEDSVRSDHDAQTTGGFTAEMVGMVVSVDRRMWPGINKPGGIGIISKVHDDGAIDVKYTVVGGREAKIHPQYVRLTDVNEVGKREHRQRRLYDPATGRAWEPTNDFSKVLDRISYLNALEEEVRLLRAEEDGVSNAELVGTHVDSDESSSDDEDRLVTASEIVASSSDDEESNLSLVKLLSKTRKTARPAGAESAVLPKKKKTKRAENDDDVPFVSMLGNSTATTLTRGQNLCSNNKFVAAEAEPHISSTGSGEKPQHDGQKRNASTRLSSSSTSPVVRGKTSEEVNNSFIQGDSCGYRLESDEEEVNDHPTVSKVYRRKLRGMVCTDVVKEGKNTARFLEKFLDRFESKLSSLNSTSSDRDYSRRYARRERKNEKKKLLFQQGLDQFQLILLEVDKKKRDDTLETIQLDSRYERIVSRWSTFQRDFKVGAERCNRYAEGLQKEYFSRQKKTRQNRKNAGMDKTLRSSGSSGHEVDKILSGRRQNKADIPNAFPNSTGPGTRKTRERVDDESASHSSELDENRPPEYLFQNDHNAVTSLQSMVERFCGDEVRYMPLHRVKHVGGPKKKLEWDAQFHNLVSQIEFIKTSVREHRAQIPSMDLYERTMKTLRHEGREVERRADTLLELLSRAKRVRDSITRTDEPGSNRKNSAVVLDVIREDSLDDVDCDERELRDTHSFPRHFDVELKCVDDLVSEVVGFVEEVKNIADVVHAPCAHDESELCKPLNNFIQMTSPNDLHVSCNVVKISLQTLSRFFLGIHKEGGKMQCFKIEECKRFFVLFASFIFSSRALENFGEFQHVLLESLCAFEASFGVVDMFQMVLNGDKNILGRLPQLSLYIEYFCHTLKWASQVASYSRDVTFFAGRVQHILKLMSILLLGAPELVCIKSDNTYHTTHLQKLMASILAFAPKECEFDVWHVLASFFSSTLQTIPCAMGSSCETSKNLYKWSMKSSSTSKECTTHGWVGTELSMEIAWGLAILCSDTELFMRKQVKSYRMVQNNSFWKTLNYLQQAWAPFLEKGRHLEVSVKESPFFRYSCCEISLPRPYDVAWKYTHKLISRTVRLINNQMPEVFQNSSGYDHAFAISTWKTLYENVWSLDVCDMMRHSGHMCHHRERLCADGEGDGYFCNNTFPTISASPRPALCCSSYAPFLVDILRPKMMLSELFERPSSFCYQPGDSQSTAMCKIIMNQFMRIPETSRKAFLSPYFRFLHKFKYPASLFLLQLEDGQEARSMYVGNKVGSLFTLKSVNELILTLALVSSQSEELASWGLKTLTKYLSKLLDISASDPEARAICVHGWTILLAIYQKIPWQTVCMKKSGGEFLRFIRASETDAPCRPTKDEQNEHVLFKFERFQRLLRLQLDCVRVLVDIGRHFSFTKTSEPVVWGFRHDEHTFINIALASLIKRFDVFSRKNIRTLMEVMSDIMRPYCKEWPSDCISENELILDVHIIRHQQKVEQSLKQDVNSLVIACKAYAEIIPQFKQILHQLHSEGPEAEPILRSAAKAIGEALSVCMHQGTQLSLWPTIHSWLHISLTTPSHFSFAPIVILGLFGARGSWTYETELSEGRKRSSDMFVPTMVMLLGSWITVAVDPNSTREHVLEKTKLVSRVFCKYECCTETSVLCALCFRISSKWDSLVGANCRRETYMESFLVELSKVRTKEEVHLLLPILRNCIFTLGNCWRSQWEGRGFSSHFVRHVYSSIRTVLVHLDGVFLCPTVSSDEQTILEIVANKFFINKLLREQVPKDQLTTSLLVKADEERKSSFWALLQSFSGLSYFTNRHISTLLKEAVVPYFWRGTIDTFGKSTYEGFDLVEDGTRLVAQNVDRRIETVYDAIMRWPCTLSEVEQRKLINLRDFVFSTIIAPLVLQEKHSLYKFSVLSFLRIILSRTPARVARARARIIFRGDPLSLLNTVLPFKGFLYTLMSDPRTVGDDISEWIAREELTRVLFAMVECLLDLEGKDPCNSSSTNLVPLFDISLFAIHQSYTVLSMLSFSSAEVSLQWKQFLEIYSGSFPCTTRTSIFHSSGREVSGSTCLSIMRCGFLTFPLSKSIRKLAISMPTGKLMQKISNCFKQNCLVFSTLACEMERKSNLVGQENLVVPLREFVEEMHAHTGL